MDDEDGNRYTPQRLLRQAEARGGDREVFILSRWRWDVSLAKQITAGRVDRMLDPGPLAAAARVSVRIDEAHLEAVDLSVPVLLVPFKRRILPIDGWHRIVRAGHLGVTVPASQLTAEEELRVRLSI